MSAVREQLKASLGVVEETQPSNPILEDLERRLQKIAPEALRGDENAVAELRTIEDAIAAERRRVDLAELARLEEADRARIAAEAEAERQREVWHAEKAEADAKTQAALTRFEKALASMLDIAKEALDANADASAAASKLETAAAIPRLNALIEDRLIRRIQEELGPVYGVRPGIVIGMAGRSPLSDIFEAVSSAVCKVCADKDRDTIDVALAGGESLRDLEERFGISRSTLSRHRAGHVTRLDSSA